MLLYSFLDCLDVKGFLLFLCVFLILADVLRNRNPPQFPPGPWRIPFLGNILINHDHKSIHKLAEKYGDVFTLRIGSKKMVFVSGYKMVKEVLVNQGDNFLDRPVSPLYLDIFKGYGLSSTNGYRWRRQRQFAVSHLKNFGEGRKMLEFHILQECSFLCEAIREQQGRFFDPHVTINNAVANVIGSLVFGHRISYGNTDFQNLLQMSAESIRLAGTYVQLYDAFPGLMKRLRGPHETIVSNYARLTAFLKKEIERHKKDWDPFDHRDFIDAYIGEIDKRKNDTEAGFCTDNLAYCTLDLFEAGTETLTNTLRWALLFIIKYPHVQKKVHDEIDRVIGPSRPPSLKDRISMPYTDAVVHEVQRMGDILPLNVPRVAKKDTPLGQYVIPTGTMVITNLSSVLRDHSEWETPDQFNPGHFLDSEGKFRRREAFYPFSAGKRACLGEQLARMEVFLFFTSLLQKFTLSAPPGVELCLDPQGGATMSPKPFQMCFSDR
ncbi:cytochrome P450 2J2-like [Megalops cyprinoides]|uniref:cytochrome P450 2J2-like n=1 Tax=Megalops cyprinoides TaxID=118141 RepID=UPI00186526F6|nr:cytochrome P450 2J2-like [Megalops cyprinoides]